MAPKRPKNNPPRSRLRTGNRLARARSETISHRKEDFFAKAFRLSPHPIGITELETGRCLEINDACLKIFGFRRDEVIGKTTLMLGIWPDPRARATLIARLQAEGSIRDYAVSMQMKDGDLRQFLISTDLITLKGKRCLLTIGHDISGLKRAEEALRLFTSTLEQQVAERTAALRESEERLQDLTAKLLTTQESERQRIARDLHDDFTQRLATLAVDAGLLERLCGTDWALYPRCRSMREAAGQLADDMHNFAYRLRPSLLEHLGLEAAIRDHVDEFAQRTGLVVQYVQKDIPSAIPIDKATCLYRVIQECLQNVMKHAGASEVRVRLIGTSHGVGVCVRDNGKGFAQDTAGIPARGLGLISMQERVRLFGGRFRIRAYPGGGTEIHAWLPVADAVQAIVS
jgi:PAS domain S-box-containing protein